MRLLCVAEKNSIAKEVAHILSGGSARTRNSTWKYVKNYDFSCSVPGMGLCDVTMTAVSGHILGSDFGPEHAWGKCPPGRLFDAPIVTKVTADKDKRSQRIHDNIVQEARAADRLMIWTDCDREGEYIGWEVLHIAAARNPRLSAANTWRAQFSHLEPAHIRAALASPKRLDMRLVEAVETRMEFDLRVGTSFTRFLTTLYRSRKLVGDQDVVSYGTCQFPTLSFVVDRYMRVRSFTREPFWTLDVVVAQDTHKVPFAWARGHMFDRAFVAAVYSRLLRAPDAATVTHVGTRPTSHFKPFPLTTVDMQKCCSRFFRMSAKQALDAAESLYTAGFILYPRTETDRFPDNMDLRAYVAKQTQDAAWGPHAQRLLADAFRAPRAGRHDDRAHPPIYPVKYAAASALKGDARKVYEFVVRRFLACCSDDARGLQTTVAMQWRDEHFSAAGLQVTHRNFLDVYPYVDWKSSATVPAFTAGQAVRVHSARLKDGLTTPPTHMTEPELIALMDANGIGTDATIADHIDKIVARNYVTRRKAGKTEIFVPTSLGISLIQAFDAILADRISLAKPYLRRALEGFLVRISRGELSKPHVVQQLLPLYKEAFLESNQKSLVITQTLVDTNSRIGAQ
ncbi:prokaryotic type I DNA topoisomerase [Metschnikowia bicuspidata var. bicuspidata NRRL YB-4993]|uniref:DNA topoisomerase n=1 Tax=Metschnikowia bicuspidata var. bicuspidata NRRL YB-4993 TaxID=869754 RepID=A0A1A0H9Q7_9ASCO|nr:prokaryotic type I DNA topoisomerase [Metschnikowia bicuspidata var. bicuspidata NRRL YB-4993]OBA20617.1 prokaryotic type I DNA topoisomerase [Metschnikowia bicuspidata var. bicuspidata NRRL YB-4993]